MKREDIARAARLEEAAKEIQNSIQGLQRLPKKSLMLTLLGFHGISSDSSQRLNIKLEDENDLALLNQMIAGILNRQLQAVEGKIAEIL